MIRTPHLLLLAALLAAPGAAALAQTMPFMMTAGSKAPIQQPMPAAAAAAAQQIVYQCDYSSDLAHYSIYSNTACPQGWSSRPVGMTNARQADLRFPPAGAAAPGQVYKCQTASGKIVLRDRACSSKMSGGATGVINDPPPPADPALAVQSLLNTAAIYRSISDAAIGSAGPVVVLPAGYKDWQTRMDERNASVSSRSLLGAPNYSFPGANCGTFPGCGYNAYSRFGRRR